MQEQSKQTTNVNQGPQNRDFQSAQNHQQLRPEPPAAQNYGQDKSLMDQAKDTTGLVVDKVQEQATTRFEEQKQTAVTGLSSVAGAVREVSDKLKQQEQGGIANYAGEYGKKAAEQIEGVTTYLREHDVNQLVDEVEGFARRQPAYFLGAAFLVGFVGVRFLKSSKPSMPKTPVSNFNQLAPAPPFTPASMPANGGA